MNTLVEHRWVRVMTDYCADPVWDKNGFNADVMDLPVSAELQDSLRAWEDWFDNRASNSPIPNFEQFNLLGFRMAVEVKRQLPDWVVFFFDMGALKEPWEFEITEDMVKFTLPPPSAKEVRKLF